MINKFIAILIVCINLMLVFPSGNCLAQRAEKINSLNKGDILVNKMKQIDLSKIYKIKNLLVLVAMDAEYNALKQILNFKPYPLKTKTKLNLESADIAEHNIYLSKAGVGTVNAALTAALINEKLPIDAIILLGVGGALNTDLKIGDIVLGKTVIQHDCVYIDNKNKYLMAPGALYLSLDKNKRLSPNMASDKVLYKWALASLGQQESGRTDYYEGTIVSGNAFVADSKAKKELSKLSDNILMVDMESAGVAQFARDNNIPFVVIKTVSDRLSPKKSISEDYKQFLQYSAKNSAGIFSGMVKIWKEYAE